MSDISYYGSDDLHVHMYTRTHIRTYVCTCLSYSFTVVNQRARHLCSAHKVPHAIVNQLVLPSDGDNEVVRVRFPIKLHKVVSFTVKVCQSKLTIFL